MIIVLIVNANASNSEQKKVSRFFKKNLDTKY
jgi:hypothetical protein